MRGYIYSQKQLIGITNFKHAFDAMGYMWGSFTPNDAYIAIRKQVQEFCSSDNRDFKQWRDFRFNVQLENGYFILPVGGYEIYDFPQFSDEPLSFHIAGAPWHIFRDFFKKKRRFLLAPWQPLTIVQKIEHEDELLAQTGITNVQFSALAKHAFEDEILFTCHGDIFPLYAIASLRPEEKSKVEEIFPDKNYFQSFRSFYRRMKRDNNQLRGL